MAQDLREIMSGEVLILALDRPERRNSMDLAVTREMASALDRAAENEGVKVVILQGYAHGFGAGSDLKSLAGQSVKEMIDDEREMAALARSFNRHPKPIIAAVDGYAIGGGAIYAASCDVVITSATAKWALPEVPIGWNAAYGIAAMQTRLGASRSRHILWGAEGFDGKEACRVGLADFLSDETAAEAALRYATRLASLPAHAVLATKKLCAGAIDFNAVGMDEQAMDAFQECLKTSSAQATLAKFGLV